MSMMSLPAIETSNGLSPAGMLVDLVQEDCPGVSVQTPATLLCETEPVSSPLKTSPELAVTQTRRVTPFCWAPAKERMLEPLGNPPTLAEVKLAPPSVETIRPESVPT